MSIDVTNTGTSAWDEPLAADLGPDGRPRRPLVVLRSEDQASWPSEHSTHGGQPGTDLNASPVNSGLRPMVVLVHERTGTPHPKLVELADIVLDRDGGCGQAVQVADPSRELDDLSSATLAVPCTALILCQLLRTETYEDVVRGLFIESAVYSMLQAGDEFAHWRATRTRCSPHPDDEAARVRVEREGQLLRVTLTRPARRNALDLRMRDELLAALAPARWDPLLKVELTGEGPSFCAGGDLDEFGTAPVPPVAHLVRLETSLGAVLHELRDRLTVCVHGHCFGAGVEMAAFAGHVIASPEAIFTLPEVAMGLIPGAGGTTSIPRRIGRHRTLWMALSGKPVDAETALSWGLIDAIA